MKLELKMKLICLGLLTLAQAARAEGGDHSGGGAVGVCFDDSIIVQKIKANENRILTDQVAVAKSVEVLDLLQAEMHFSAHPEEQLILMQEGEEPLAYVRRIANRFKDTLPALKKKIEEEADKIENADTRYYPVKNSVLGIDRVYDSKESYYLDPEKCVIATAIRQSMLGSTLILEIDKRLIEKQSAAIIFLLYLH